MELTRNSLVRRVEGLMESEVDGYTVMLHVERGHYYSIDAVGSWIWSQLDKPQSVAQLSQLMTVRYQVEAEEAERDLLEFLTAMATQKVIEVA